MEEAGVKVNDIIFECCVRSRCSQKHAVISQKDSYNACASLCWWSGCITSYRTIRKNNQLYYQVCLHTKVYLPWYWSFQNINIKSHIIKF